MIVGLPINDVENEKTEGEHEARDHINPLKTNNSFCFQLSSNFLNYKSTNFAENFQVRFMAKSLGCVNLEFCQPWLLVCSE